MFKRTLICFTICALLIAGLPLAAGAATVNTNVNVSVSAVDQVGANGSINWDEGFVEATGTGVPSSIAKSPAQARLMARRAAIVDAQRNLLESIEGVKITAETTVKNFETTNDTVRTQVTGIVKGSKIVNEQQVFDGTYQVTLRVNLYGHGSLAEVIVDATAPVTPAPLPSPSPSSPPVALPVYTGLVVDVSGLPLERAMSPVIFDDTGRAVYGHTNIIPEYAISQGMVDYMCTTEDIRAVELGQSRAGTTPIMVKAIGLRDHNVNIIISQADADRILAANAQSNFLPRAMVCVRQ
ncbi:LPP20 family lipoprotein [Sporomusa termitida]|uniref:Lipoprotein LPP20-like domain-containing protein n=1 Tax=Sporomusa termitida TaxID=2377 RepID=A0A517E0Q0_9FIRM|nr:LPP20 family lipoprotein [Sporomusa termitida]QDR83181.1 hypothetical protein SPTER_46590 [Sporomusa termitida]